MASPVLDQLVALRLLTHRDDIIRERRVQLTRQRDRLAAALRAHLPEWSFTVPEGGASLWVELDAPVSSALAQAAVAHGVILASGPRFGVDGTLERYVRLPFHLPEEEIDEAVRRLAAARADLDRLHPLDWSTPALVA
jgi:DNA-binding transcriptional MocR family regulator